MKILKDCKTMWAIVPPEARSLNGALGLYDNKDEDGLRLYGCAEITLFGRRSEAKRRSLVWPGAMVVPVTISQRNR